MILDFFEEDIKNAKTANTFDKNLNLFRPSSVIDDNKFAP